mmetsp:Transcript_35703/g.87319  ORF Transcript_35703/g.87319 Transcript_35703/m.87319 type:complete len:115 (+) Transcript_35703:210-554(+)|eukprot:CAMPEP_0198329678 /NCGR_PEP_ID=MMETSP1450-20131203/16373_1 /TAXON_ID=753684 ORGANISM="Madagascaria erythrocladiodes, Strain CCMP3234" /NCGR_SAMPLE_ID=MMETSP1450 /ASSEMBLY_ACC=CAM_ASM_001115 /LENGTH=114 /DNA_ID=CAMNT_0044033919 /DNA_START=188 /DNA_END=532 /DNA_ORIENTATION=+
MAPYIPEALEFSPYLVIAPAPFLNQPNPYASRSSSGVSAASVAAAVETGSSGALSLSSSLGWSYDEDEKMDDKGHRRRLMRFVVAQEFLEDWLCGRTGLTSCEAADVLQQGSAH